MEVLRWEGSLAMFWLPTNDPMEDLVKLKHIENATFSRVRDDGELCEEILFETEPDGSATGLLRHSNMSPRIQ